jgi:hypothetical protein
MPLRVRYRPNDLSEGVVEEIMEADSWRVEEDGSVTLSRNWEHEDGVIKKHKVGVLRPGCWDLVVVMEEAE